MPDPLSNRARFGGSDNTAAYNTIHTMHYDTTAPNVLQSGDDSNIGGGRDGHMGIMLFYRSITGEEQIKLCLFDTRN